MNAGEKMPEENIGAASMIAKRAEECFALAEACEAEAREQAESVARLRARAERLRDLGFQYRTAARSLDEDALTDQPLRLARGGVLHPDGSGRLPGTAESS